ncbi:hypothetical protein BDA99DRAFT_539213 [Phascolomyces articulosus]|uniref:Uncharacterized protein n=1 Tax=Phascolomyces articulosus TaxID=60185 RepID=A0AAD5JWW9_9FUNG|nr:hypothetical protein BDA99DRAFT_539213 [Phascolomyces articulosus]
MNYADLPSLMFSNCIWILGKSALGDSSRPDFVKLANEIKDSIDKMVKDDYDDDRITVVLGVLVEVRLSIELFCSLFSMYLILLMTATYESMITLRKYMLAYAHKCFAFHQQTVFQQTIRSKYIIETFNTPESQNSKNSNDD